MSTCWVDLPEASLTPGRHSSPAKLRKVCQLASWASSPEPQGNPLRGMNWQWLPAAAWGSSFVPHHLWEPYTVWPGRVPMAPRAPS